MENQEDNKSIKKGGVSNLIRVFILIFAIAFFAFGVYQTIVFGITYSYWIFIYSALLLVAWIFVKRRKKSDVDGK